MEPQYLGYSGCVDQHSYRLLYGDSIGSMLVYGSISVNTITYVTVAITTGTVLLCYALAVGLGHVPAWLPLISDCAVEAPEKYPFRIGVIFGAVALFANIVLVYWAFPSFSYRRTSTAFGLAASVAFAIVGAINEKENDVAHSSRGSRARATVFP